MNVDTWINREPYPAGSPAYTAVVLELGRAVERLQARLAAAPAPLPVVEIVELPEVTRPAEPMIDLHRPRRRGPYQRRGTARSTGRTRVHT
jgi:hypothetical protein